MVMVPWQSRWPALLTFSVVILAVIYATTDRGLFGKGSKCFLHSLGATFLIAVAAAASVWCYLNHVCMAGHMKHPPYPVWHGLCDMAWTTTTIGAALWIVRVRSPLSIAIAYSAAFLLSYRFVFGSLGGIWPIPL